SRLVRTARAAAGRAAAEAGIRTADPHIDGSRCGRHPRPPHPRPRLRSRIPGGAAAGVALRRTGVRDPGPGCDLAGVSTRFTRGAGPPCGKPPGDWPRMGYRCRAEPWLGEAEPTLRR